ncbi:hypothetical protein G647_04564 [Cladophialophora carrionii CBS 160.54]|uniref:Uncharacterized protein n=1 Tax=Cladophialophora carrionii CBS 160.54 TaxID=1279043 RepID=V9DER5_9EURO|nr:uncharacterized protein G647_04564 [Cladophialophora carrionii CBS 160.54]ETI25191.1 hypothetical protein G647_04564 [Cladophialophora carrionii CBS 160.54]
MALVPKYRVRKRPRRESSDGFSVEEMSPDDMGYDGDIEVLHPDQYEEPESEFEDEALKKLWPDTDDELASRLRRLSCERQPKSAHRGDYAYDRGRKRLSTEMDDDEDESPALDATEIEISELVDGHAAQPPMKRRRKRSERTPLGQRVVKRQAQEAWTDSSDKSEDAALESSNSPSTPERTTTPSKPRGPDDSDAMEIG